MMKIHHINLGSTIKEKMFFLAIGNFDGIHLGHQTIIKKLVKDAESQNKPSAILSFNPHPRQFFNSELKCYQIISDHKKQEILTNLGVRHYFCLRFDKLIANLSPSDFINEIIIQKMNVNRLIVGGDFKFGKNREGDVRLLSDHSVIHGFDLEIIESVKNIVEEEIYSSTSVRNAIRSGNFEKVQSMLGYKWTMEGKVINGDRRARKMNFPTANLLPHKQIYPKKGVYVVNISLNDRKYQGIANFGERPTVDGKKLLLEVHIFNFNEDIYGNHLTVEFLTFIRGEQKFDSFSLLVEQIKKDIQIAKNYHLNL